MHAHARRYRELRPYAVIGQGDLIVAGNGFFRIVVVPATVSAVGIIGRPGVQFYRPGSGHQEDIAQVRMAGSAEVRVAETHDRRVAVAVSSAVFIHFGLIFPAHIVRDGVRIGTQLHPAEGDTGTREGVTHPVRSDKGCHEGGVGRGRLRQSAPAQAKQN